MIGALLWIPAFAGMTGENDGGGLCAGMTGETCVWRESMVAVLVLRDNTASFPRRRESMIAVPVLMIILSHSRVGGNPLGSFSRSYAQAGIHRIRQQLRCRLGKAERTQRPGCFHSRCLSSYLSELPSCQVRCSHIRFFRLLVTPV